MSDYMFLSGHRQLLYLIDFQHVKELSLFDIANYIA